MQPKTQAPIQAPPPPTVNDARLKAEQDDLLRRRQGRAATFLSEPSGRAAGGVATKQLMGQGG